MRDKYFYLYYTYSQPKYLFHNPQYFICQFICYILEACQK